MSLAECHCAECHCAECRCPECRCPECHGAENDLSILNGQFDFPDPGEARAATEGAELLAATVGRAGDLPAGLNHIKRFYSSPTAKKNKLGRLSLAIFWLV